MIDRENTISNLETNIRWIENPECPQFPGWGNVTMAMRDALELLKEQEPVEPKVIRDNEFGNPVYACGKCGQLITESMNYCSWCGRKVGEVNAFDNSK